MVYDWTVILALTIYIACSELCYLARSGFVLVNVVGKLRMAGSR